MIPTPGTERSCTNSDDDTLIVQPREEYRASALVVSIYHRFIHAL
jgi:hypothetical protein